MPLMNWRYTLEMYSSLSDGNCLQVQVQGKHSMKIPQTNKYDREIINYEYSENTVCQLSAKEARLQ